MIFIYKDWRIKPYDSGCCWEVQRIGVRGERSKSAGSACYKTVVYPATFERALLYVLEQEIMADRSVSSDLHEVVDAFKSAARDIAKAAAACKS